MKNQKIKILIAGDSFASDWTPKSIDFKGWVNLLADRYDVTNVAESGVSEYKILKQLERNNLDLFDYIIVCHTSPYRLHTISHPIKYKSVLHTNSDMLYADIEYHYSKWYNVFNKSLKTAYNWFVYHYDKTFYEDIYKLMYEKIENILVNHNSIEIDNFNKNTNKLNYMFYCTPNSGVNHFDEVTNKRIYQEIKNTIDARSK